MKLFSAGKTFRRRKPFADKSFTPTTSFADMSYADLRQHSQELLRWLVPMDPDSILGNLTRKYQVCQINARERITR